MKMPGPQSCCWVCEQSPAWPCCCDVGAHYVAACCIFILMMRSLCTMCSSPILVTYLVPCHFQAFAELQLAFCELRIPSSRVSPSKGTDKRFCQWSARHKWSEAQLVAGGYCYDCIPQRCAKCLSRFQVMCLDVGGFAPARMQL